MMTSVQLEDLTFVFLVSLLHAYQLTTNARRVGTSRRKFKISPPEMNGPPEFLRTLRVQQNDLEFSVMFQVVLWVTGICVHQAPAALAGLLYVYARKKYADGYVEDAANRTSGFHWSVNAIKLLLLFSVIGIVRIAISQFLGVDLTVLLREKFAQSMKKGEL